MPIDRALIAKKLDFLDTMLTRIERTEVDERAFVDDPDIHDVIVFRLQQAVETAIDIAVHLIAHLDIPRKETAKDAFLLLGDEHIIEEKLAQSMGKAADFRNRVVHGYNDFDYRELFRDYRQDVADLREFGAQILVFLDSPRARGGKLST